MKTKILWEDKDLIVCHKPAGLAVQTSRLGQQDMESELKNYRKNKEGRKNPYLGIIHRLDQPVEGLLVFAKNPKVAADLNAQTTDGRMEKRYLALLFGIPEKREAVLENYLKKNGKENLSEVVKKDMPGAKKSRLTYRILKVYERLPETGEWNVLKADEEIEKERRTVVSLAEICLETGRHHQIRVQMEKIGCPLLGDRKYNSKQDSSEEINTEQNSGENRMQVWPGLALCAYRLSFFHPVSGKKQEFSVQPEGEIFQLFEREKKR